MYLSASAVMIHYEEALYIKCTHLTLTYRDYRIHHTVVHYNYDDDGSSCNDCD